MAEEPVPARFRPALSAVIQRVADGDFAGLARDGIYSRGGDLGLWIRRYGGHGATIIPLPEEAWEFADASALDGRPGEWFVVVDLWSAEEGRSDLSMEAIVIESDGALRIEIRDIHAL